MALDPQHIPDLPTLRGEIDALDSNIIALLARRHALITRAAEIKRGNGLPARIDDRVEEVVANARSHAARLGMNADLIADLWRQLVEEAIAQEERYLKGSSE